MVMVTQSMAYKNALILSDKKPGHFYQSIGLALQLKKYNIINNYKILNVPINNRILKSISSIITPNYIIKDLKIKDIDNYSIIIDTGSTTQWYSIAIKKVYPHLKNIHILKPVLPFFFDVVLIPYHDNITFKNSILFNIAFNTCTPENIKKHALELEQYISKSNIKPDSSLGILIGGNSKNYKMISEEIENTLKYIIKNNIPILITTSRRTPKNILNKIKPLINNYKHALLKIFPDEKSYNPIPGMFYFCSKILVTEDSFSMISEAITSKKMVGIILSNKQQNKKIRKGFKYLKNYIYLISNLDDLNSFLNKKNMLNINNPYENIIKKLEKILKK